MEVEVAQAQQRQELLGRVFESRQFRRAPKLRELMAYLAARSLLPEPVDIREQEIGCGVYGRSPGYNPSEDSIARVEIRNLRRKLDEYFQTDGASEPVIITIPKGNYRLSFQPRIAASTTFEVVPPPTPGRRPLFAAFLLGGILTCPISLAIGAWYLGRSGSPPAAPFTQRVPLWSDLLDGVRNTYVVIADSVWSEAQYIFGKQYSLADYLSMKVFSRDLPPRWRGLDDDVAHIFSRQYTSVADVQLVSRIAQLPNVNRQRLIVRFARDMKPRDFKGNNVILLGSVRANPWVHMFEESMNFQFEFDSRRKKPFFRNKSIRHGEREIYVAGGDGGESDEIYARAAFLPNLTRDGHILSIVGTMMEGTEAVGELLTDTNSLVRLARELHLDEGSKMRYFELLIKSSTVGGSSGRAEVVGHRLLPQH